MKNFLMAMLLVAATTATAEADTIDGRLVSIRTETREITLERGETLHLTENVAIESLSIGQLIRAEYENGTVNVTSVAVLEEAPLVDLTEEPILEE